MGRPERAPLEALHRALAQSLMAVLNDGAPIYETDKRTGEVREVGRAPAPAPYISAAVRFLRDNGVCAVETDAQALTAELGDLPRFEDDDLSEEDLGPAG